MPEKISNISQLPKWKSVGMVARWQPVHLGHQSVLHALSDRSEEVQIGIGSSNAHDYRNPFTIDEVREMLELVLDGRGNVSLVAVPDLHDGPRWREMVTELFGTLDIFFTDNPYVAHLMQAVYPVSRPVAVVPPGQRAAISGSMVRGAMAKGLDWQAMVPPEVAGYLTDHQLTERFRREFGLQTLAAESMIVERSK